MFNDLVISGANSQKTNKPWTVVVSTIIQAAILGVLILIPLIYTEALPKGMLTTFIVPPPPPPPPPPPAAAIQRIVKPVVHLIKNGQMMAPTVIPKKIEMIKEEAAPPDVGVSGGVVGGVAGGSAGGVLGGIIGGGGGITPPPTPSEGQGTAARRWSGPSRELDSSGPTGLSADRQDGAHLGNRGVARDHFKGRRHRETRIRLRTSVVDEKRHGRGEPMALPAHHAQWRTGGSGYYSFCCLYFRRLVKKKSWAWF